MWLLIKGMKSTVKSVIWRGNSRVFMEGDSRPCIWISTGEDLDLERKAETLSSQLSVPADLASFATKGLVRIQSMSVHNLGVASAMLRQRFDT